jgi:TonB family protein
MGAVYKAMHVRFEEVRALKVISTELASDPSFVKRFIHEAVITRKLQHPNAVRVEDVDEAEDGRPFIVMEFMEGRSLKSLMREEGPLPAPRVCAIIKQAAAALGAAHTLCMVHRDIKPDNIFLLASPDGDHVKVLDFGIAKVKEASLASANGITQTKTGLIVGTPHYMSPEQAMGMRGDELDGRSDLYSLGIVMYEMLSGVRPFDADTTMKILMAHIHQPPPPLAAAHPELQIPTAVVNVVMRLLEKKRESRPAIASDLIKEIESALHAPAARLVTTQVVMPSEAVSASGGGRGQDERDGPTRDRSGAELLQQEKVEADRATRERGQQERSEPERAGTGHREGGRFAPERPAPKLAEATQGITPKPKARRRWVVSLLVVILMLPGYWLYQVLSGYLASATLPWYVQEAPSTLPGGVKLIHVGEQVQSARLVFQPKPVYPILAEIVGVQGTVRLRVVIGSDGTVQEVKFMTGPRFLVKVAMDAVARWRYQPTLLNGEAVAVDTEVEVPFALTE